MQLAFFWRLGFHMFFLGFFKGFSPQSLLTQQWFSGSSFSTFISGIACSTVFISVHAITSPRVATRWQRCDFGTPARPADQGWIPVVPSYIFDIWTSSDPKNLYLQFPVGGGLAFIHFIEWSTVFVSHLFFILSSDNTTSGASS